jgi:PadR family transcriptional regulator PadR
MTFWSVSWNSIKVPFKAPVMDLENTKVLMKKGILEFCMLQIISRGEVNASDLIDELANARLIVAQGPVYPLLSRLKHAGLVDYQWVTSSFGPPRKFFKLTDSGNKFLAGLTETWEEMTRATEMIRQRSKKSE